MASDKACYWLAAVVLALGLTHSLANRHSDWLALATARASMFAQQFAGGGLEHVASEQLAIGRCPELQDHAMQAQFAAMRMEFACRRAQMQSLQAQMNTLSALQTRTRIATRTMVIPPQTITVQVPQADLPKLQIRKLPHEGTI